MNKLKILIPTALAAPITVAPFVTSCASCAYENEVNYLLDTINNKFDKPLTELGKVSTSAEALTKYADLFKSDENKRNEILFGCFNFLCKKGLTITADSNLSVKMTPDNKSFYDLCKDGSVRINMGYNINLYDVESDHFSFTMAGYLVCGYIGNVDAFKGGDYVQFAYDLNAKVQTTFVATEVSDKINMSVKYSFPQNSSTESYGFIQFRKNEQYYPAVSINDMNDVNYDANGYGYNRGYYTINAA